jgi:hypothetical protein
MVLLSEVAKVTCGFPAGNVDLTDLVRKWRVGGGFKFVDDFLRWKAVIDGGVDEVAEWFGQLGDFAMELFGFGGEIDGLDVGGWNGFGEELQYFRYS